MAPTLRWAPHPPTRLGRYSLLAPLAAGGMGELFVAELAGAADFRKLVVIKRLLPHLAARPEFEELFFNEARIAARLNHPNVCHVYELERVEGQYYIAMEYLEGATLGQIARDLGGAQLANVQVVVSLLYQVCEGLHHVHELSDAAGEPLGIVHRDISPSNLFVTTDGIAKVLDFGIAKIRAAVSNPEHSSLKGKFAYMSPEQLNGEAVDRRSDLFSFAAVAFEALTGRRLFDQKTDALVVHAIMEGRIQLPGELRAGVPPAIDAVLLRALAPDPAGRFSTARELGEAMVDALGGTIVPPGRIAAALAVALDPYVTDRRTLIDHATSVTLADKGQAGGGDDSPRYSRVGANDPTVLAAGPSTRVTPAMSGSRRRGWIALLLAGVAIGTAGGVGAWWLTHDRATPEPATTVAAAPAAAPAVAIDAAPPSIDAAPTIDAARTIDAAPHPGAAGGSADAGGAPPADRPPPRRPHRPPPPAEPASVAAPGYLSVASTPYASITVDGKAIGDTPIYRLELSAGEHVVRAVAAGRERRIRVSISPGKTTTRHIYW